MKELQPDDPRYTAYVLGELSPKEGKIIAEKIEEDPSLKDEMSKTQALGKMLCEAYEREGLSLHPVQRAVIKRVGQNQDVIAMRSARRRNDWLRGAGIAVAAAAAVVIGLFILAKTPVENSGKIAIEPEQLQMDVVLSPAALTNWGGAEGKRLAVNPTSDSAVTVKVASQAKARQEFTQRVLNDPQRFFASAVHTLSLIHI